MYGKSIKERGQILFRKSNPTCVLTKYSRCLKIVIVLLTLADKLEGLIYLHGFYNRVAYPLRFHRFSLEVLYIDSGDLTIHIILSLSILWTGKRKYIFYPHSCYDKSQLTNSIAVSHLHNGESQVSISVRFHAHTKDLCTLRQITWDLMQLNTTKYSRYRYNFSLHHSYHYSMTRHINHSRWQNISHGQLIYRPEPTIMHCQL